MTGYLYRCSCGYEEECKFAAHEAIPEVLSDTDEHPTGPVDTFSRVLCYGNLRRVWALPVINHGYRTGVHTPEDRFRFAHL
jgi:hypothetical protein